MTGVAPCAAFTGVPRGVPAAVNEIFRAAGLGGTVHRLMRTRGVAVALGSSTHGGASERRQAERRR